MAVQPKHRQLPDKETKLFKELLTQYELKQYKKGIKAADTILKKFPNHGETIALKALTMQSSLPYPATVSSNAKLVEIEEMARTAVKKDMTSHITWHVLGIMARNRKDYKEASKAYGQARKIDPDNIPLLRDSMSLYLHTRQYAMAVQVRQHFLTLRPQMRSSWIGLMVAHHLNGDIPSALEVFDGLKSCTKEDGGSGPEKAQTLLYVIKLCIEQGSNEDALSRLEKGLESKIISARGEVSQLRAELYGKLGRKSDATNAYQELLKQNPDNLAYYEGLLRTEGLDIKTDLSEEERKQVLERLEGFRETYPKSPAPRRLSLVVAQGETFRKLARDYLIAGLEKGVPSLFVDVKGLYRDASKMAAVGEIVEELVVDLETEKLHDDDSIPPPTTLLWAYYFLALHLSHPLNAEPSHSRALDLLSKALEHTPTLPEIYMARALVLKRAGDPQGAAQSMEEARLLDGQDRFLNGKAAKYWLRAGNVAKAEELLVMFTKKDMAAAADLTEMQCLWFLQEEGDSYRRNGNLAMALKRYQSLATTFRDYEDDHYDFHQYCLRRMTMSAYVELMRYEDQLYSHPGYYNGALAAIEIYTRIHDHPDLTEEKLTEEEEADRKRAAKKAQKAEQKAKKAAAAASDGTKSEPPAPDDDPDGTKLLKTTTPLDDALKLWEPLQKLAGTRIETWISGFEIYIRKGMYLAALKCLNESAAIDKNSAELHRQIIHFNRIVSSAELDQATRSAIEKAFTLIPEGTSPSDLNSQFLTSNSTSAPHILSAASAALELESGEVEKILNKLLESSVPPTVVGLTSAIEILQRSGASDERVAEFRGKCRERLPLAWVFASEQEKSERKLGEEGDRMAVNGEKSDV